ncbi:MAG: hypothetical protein DRP02_14025 [Candidatus Gerdarchaeota archaeon]|nr:MAG: hypothetical protein DRP02_14025 [Candidatus Gerdarchaeota archaeon]
MKVLVIYAHPNKKSFCAAIKQALLKGLEKNQNEVRIHDLYEMKFDPILSYEELVLKEGKEDQEQLKKLQQDILWAKKIIIIHPTWWYGTPAILKGYFDRVLSEGFAYRYETDHPVPLLQGKEGMIIQTFDAEEKVEKGLLEDIAYKNIYFTWSYCGITKWQRVEFFEVNFVDNKQRQKWLQSVQELGARIK